MKRLYYAFLPENTSRPGGVWWYKDLSDNEALQWIDSIKACACHIRLSDTFPMHDPMHINPPVDSKIIK
jgi:hypothetical protein